MQTFCTIVTPDYFPMARTLYYSLNLYSPGTSLHVLILGEIPAFSDKKLVIHSFDEIKKYSIAADIEKKYGHTNEDIFRWALKPIFISYLLQSNFEKVIYCDPDIYFVNDYGFLFEYLDTSQVLLTPHWADLDITTNPDSMLSALRCGLVNGGFVGANKKGIEAINWWAAMCHYKMDRKADLGIYDDQKYLDAILVQFENTLSLKHQGCNLASWNIKTCKREMVNGLLLINKTYEPVFIHFAKDTIINILNKNDQLLKPYLDEYIKALQNENFDLLKRLDKVNIQNYNSIQYSVKHKLRLRTRLKRFLFKLAEKL